MFHIFADLLYMWESVNLLIFCFRLCQLLTCLLFIQTCYAYQMYQERIPNGESVPHPCMANNFWRAVGHLNLRGGGDRNPFGEDFKNNGGVRDDVSYQSSRIAQWSSVLFSILYTYFNSNAAFNTFPVISRRFRGKFPVLLVNWSWHQLVIEC